MKFPFFLLPSEEAMDILPCTHALFAPGRNSYSHHRRGTWLSKLENAYPLLSWISSTNPDLLKVMCHAPKTELRLSTSGTPHHELEALPRQFSPKDFHQCNSHAKCCLGNRNLCLLILSLLTINSLQTSALNPMVSQKYHEPDM